MQSFSFLLECRQLDTFETDLIHFKSHTSNHSVHKAIQTLLYDLLFKCIQTREFHTLVNGHNPKPQPHKSFQLHEQQLLIFFLLPQSNFPPPTNMSNRTMQPSHQFSFHILYSALQNPFHLIYTQMPYPILLQPSFPSFNLFLLYFQLLQVQPLTQFPKKPLRPQTPIFKTPKSTPSNHSQASLHHHRKTSHSS